MSGSTAKKLSMLASRAWRNMPPPIRATWSYRTVLEWTKRQYQALPSNEKARWLKQYKKRLDDGFHPVSPKSLMPRST